MAELIAGIRGLKVAKEILEGEIFGELSVYGSY
jgi:hypothetical protein